MGLLWKNFDIKVLDNTKCVEEAVFWMHKYHVQIWITTLKLHLEGHVEEIQSKKHASFYVAKVEGVNVENIYFLLVYIGISFVEFMVFISLQNLTYTQSTSTNRKEFSLRECMNHETPIFTLMQKYFNSIYFPCPITFIHTSF